MINEDYIYDGRYLGHHEQINEKISTDFLILGHPRSGTGYISRLFSEYGVQIGHECIDRHGISCWTFVTKKSNHLYGVPKNKSQLRIKGITRQDLNYKHLIHNVRNPFDVINSVYQTESKTHSHIFRLLHCEPKIDEKLDILSQCILSVTRWNKMIENINPEITFKVEGCEEDVKNYLNDLGYTINNNNIFKDKKYNARKKSNDNKLTIKDYKNIESYILNELDEYCKKYGYENILK